MAVVAFCWSMAAVLSVVRWSMPNWLDWPYRMNGKVWSCYGSVRQVDDLEELDIGIQAIAAIPVGASGEGIGESDVRVKLGGVTFFSGDHLYADNTGIILSEDPLDIE